jgi:hypothetical protein
LGTRRHTHRADRWQSPARTRRTTDRARRFVVEPPAIACVCSILPLEKTPPVRRWPRTGEELASGGARAVVHQLALRTRRKAVPDPDGRERWFVSPEDLTILELLHGRPKDRLDLERLFAVRDDLDRDYVESWITRMVAAGDRRLALLGELRRARRSAP